MSVSAVPSLTHSVEPAAKSQPVTSAALWADEAAAAMLEILQQEPDGADDDDSPKLADAEKEEGSVAAVRAVTTRDPSTVAPRKDFRGGPVVDWVISGWQEPAPVATPDLFAMVKELPGRPAAGLASIIGHRLRVPSPERRQLSRRVAAMAYGYRQAQQGPPPTSWRPGAASRSGLRWTRCPLFAHASSFFIGICDYLRMTL